MALLFKPLQFGPLTLKNRIVIAPMCQYSADISGEVNYWHEQQWANFALSGAGLCIVEATAVQDVGRISPADLGLWNDQQAEKIKLVLGKIRTISPMPFAVQLAHAGRKASCHRIWEQEGQQIPPHQPQGWQTVAPSAIAFKADEHPPHELTTIEIQEIIQSFADAAKRAVAAGFDLIEIHAAHGYLLHQFLSPLSNQRSDEYGGSFDHRIRLTLEVIAAIQQAVPKDFPIGIRLSATDWMQEDSWDLASTIELCKKLDQYNLAYLHISSGGLHLAQKIEVQIGYQLEFAEEIKKVVNTPVIAVGLITEPIQAEGVLQYGQADAVAIGRAILFNPRWPWQAAIDLDEHIQIAPQYLRCQPESVKPLFSKFAQEELIK